MERTPHKPSIRVVRACACVAFAFFASVGFSWGARAGELASEGASAQADLRDAELPARADVPLFAFDSFVGPFEYRSARGLRIGDTGLHIGGFTTIEYDYEEDGLHTLELDGLNFLFTYQPVEWMRAFSEIEVGQLFEYESGQAGGVSSDPVVDVERLYLDLIPTDPLNLRVGKFQTPVGIWNLAPAEPFTWTAVEPVLAEQAFLEHTTGASLFGSFYPAGGTLDYFLYGQFTDPLDPSSDDPRVDYSAGSRLDFTRAPDTWSVGTSFLATKVAKDWSYLVGIDGELEAGPFLFSTEFVVQSGDIPDRDLWGIYLQSVAEVYRGVYLVGRYEHWDPRGIDGDANLGDLGITWIPWDFLRLKASYRLTDNRTSEIRDGFYSSLSVIF